MSTIKNTLLRTVAFIALLVSAMVLLLWGGRIETKETYKRDLSYEHAQMDSRNENVESVRLLFVGDMMFDRYIRKMSLVHGDDHLFSCISKTLHSYDVVVGNLEGPITSLPSTSMGSVIGSEDNYSFTFPTSTASLLARHNISVVTLGNNHIMNQGKKGLIQTRELLTKSNVAFFGGVRGDETVYRSDKNNVPLSYVGYNQFGGDDSSVVAKRIEEETSHGRYVIVYAHWGEEYTGVTNKVRDLAKTFVASGAKIIIGAHPHVIQESETIQGVPVYYSLGNFIFDQYFQENVMEGMVVSATISAQGIVQTKTDKVKIFKDGRTCLYN